MVRMPPGQSHDPGGIYVALCELMSELYVEFWQYVNGVVGKLCAP